MSLSYFYLPFNNDLKKSSQIHQDSIFLSDHINILPLDSVHIGPCLCMLMTWYIFSFHSGVFPKKFYVVHGNIFIYAYVFIWNGREWNRGVEETKGEVKNQFRLKRFLVNPHRHHAT